MSLSIRIEVGVDSFLFFEVFPSPFSGFLQVQDVWHQRKQSRGSALTYNANYINAVSKARPGTNLRKPYRFEAWGSACHHYCFCMLQSIKLFTARSGSGRHSLVTQHFKVESRNQGLLECLWNMPVPQGLQPSRQLGRLHKRESYLVAESHPSCRRPPS